MTMILMNKTVHRRQWTMNSERYVVDRSNEQFFQQTVITKSQTGGRGSQIVDMTDNQATVIFEKIDGSYQMINRKYDGIDNRRQTDKEQVM